MDRDLIDLADPSRVAGDVERRVDRGAHEGHVEEEHVLLGRLGLDRMDREERGRDPSHAALGDRREPLARREVRRVVGHGATHRRRPQRLDRAQVPHAGRLGQEPMELRRARALHARDEDRAIDGRRLDLRVQVRQVGEAEPGLERAQRGAAHDRTTEQMESRLLLEGAQQSPQRHEELVASEVVQARAPSRLAHELRLVEVGTADAQTIGEGPAGERDAQRRREGRQLESIGHGFA